MANAEKLQPGEIYAVAVATLPPEDIDHHASDLYLKRTPAAVALVQRLENKALLSVIPPGCSGTNSHSVSLPIGETPLNTIDRRI